LTDTLTGTGPDGAPPLPDLRTAIRTVEDPQTRRALSVLVGTVPDLAAARLNIERWFDDTMDRVSGFFKRQVQLITIAIAVFVTAVLNVDSIMIGEQLFHDSALRAALVAAATQTTSAASPSTDATQRASLEKQVAQAPLPIGWSSAPATPQSVPQTPTGWLIKVIGLLLSAAAISLGAPFWFDTLKRFVNIRSAGDKPVDSSGSTAVVTVKT
jgi:hypothetical protein